MSDTEVHQLQQEISKLMLDNEKYLDFIGKLSEENTALKTGARGLQPNQTRAKDNLQQDFSKVSSDSVLPSKPAASTGAAKLYDDVNNVNGQVPGVPNFAIDATSRAAYAPLNPGFSTVQEIPCHPGEDARYYAKLASADVQEPSNMDAEEFRRAGKEMVDYIADYLENVRERPVVSAVEPGYLKKLIPDSVPEDSDKWEDVYKDIEKVIMPGVTHWQHPNFHAYYLSASSYPAILGDMLSDGIGCLGFSWKTSPACTELEVAMMDWLGKLLQLPEEFLSGGKGGGVIQGTASESSLVSLFAARSRILQQKKAENPDLEDSDIIKNLVAYTSDEAHTSAEKACLLGGVKCHVVPSDDEESMRGEALAKAIEEDKAKGLIPFLVIATLGTTPTCAFDNLLEIGPVCQKEGAWLHVDAAYAGAAFICPEFRHWLNGVEFSDSFNFNPHKWLLVNFDCAGLWFKDASYLVDSFNMEPVYLKHEHHGKVPDLRHWQIPFGRRFRSMKLWFVLRMFGVKKLQEHIRKMVQLAHDFEDLVKSDSRFEVTHKVTMGLACFALKNQSNEVNEKLLKSLTKDGRIYLVGCKSKGRYFLRFAICGNQTTIDDIKFAWKLISETADEVLDTR